MNSHKSYTAVMNRNTQIPKHKKAFLRLLRSKSMPEDIYHPIRSTLLPPEIKLPIFLALPHSTAPSSSSSKTDPTPNL